MKYLEFTFLCTPFDEDVTDILSFYLGEIGFNSFVVEDSELKAYIIKDDFDKEALDELIANYPFDVRINYEIKQMEDKNWNEEWEKNYFSPITVGDECVIKSSFHKNVPHCKYNIIINPKMSFGTGHHQTTFLILSEILKQDFNNKVVLDMGCGTGILGILALMKGAKKVTAIDIDQWVYDNVIENIKLNNINASDINVLIGDASLLKEQKFDIILANINRNVLLNDLKIYNNVLSNGGEIYLSGFYIEDIPALLQEAAKFHLIQKEVQSLDNWAMLHLIKQ